VDASDDYGVGVGKRKVTREAKYSEYMGEKRPNADQDIPELRRYLG
jgi:hypothetical protein